MVQSERISIWQRQTRLLVRWLGTPALAAASWLAVAALLFFLWLTGWFFRPPWWIALYLAMTVAWSGVAMVAYYRDKRAAVCDRLRIPERRLLLYAALGGWPGAVLAGRLFHHKTRAASYRVRLGLTIAAHVAAVVLVLLAHLNRN